MKKTKMKSITAFYSAELCISAGLSNMRSWTRYSSAEILIFWLRSAAHQPYPVFGSEVQERTGHLSSCAKAWEYEDVNSFISMAAS